MSQTEVMDPSLEKCGERSETEGKKLCTECKTAKTPLWRIGPYGPKSLCNACGIKFRKKKSSGSAVAVSNKGSLDKKKENPSPPSSSTAAAAIATADCSVKKGNDGEASVKRGKNDKLGSKLKVGLMCLGREVVLLKRPRSPMKRRRSFKKLGEVEQAAVLLMAMSSDSVYA